MLKAGPLRYFSLVQSNRSPRNPKIPNAIRYHITDVFLDELEKVQPFESADATFHLTFPLLVEPFDNLRLEGMDKTARLKAQALLEDSRLEHL
jgi:ribosomal RNA-processing protein 1